MTLLAAIFNVIFNKTGSDVILSVTSLFSARFQNFIFHLIADEKVKPFLNQRKIEL